MSSANHTQQHSNLGHPLPGAPIPTLHPQHQHHRKEQTQQQACQAHGDDHQHQCDTPDPVHHGLMRIGRAVDLIVHGTIATLSVYVFVSMISAPKLHLNPGRSSSLIELFLFFAAGVSFVMALMYMVLAWWTRTVAGLDKIRSSHQQRLIAASSEKPIAGPQSSTSMWMCAVVILMRPRSRMWIQMILMSMSLLAALLQSRVFGTSSNCHVLPRKYQQSCETAKVVVATYLTAFVWMLWAVWCFFKSVYKTGSVHRVGDMDTEAQQLHRGGMQEEGEDGQRKSDVLIPITDSHSESAADMKVVVVGAASMSAGIAEPSKQNQNRQQHQQTGHNLPQSGNLQQSSATSTAASAENGKNPTDLGSVSSLGLGIDICTFTGDVNLLPPKTDIHTTPDRMHSNSVGRNDINDADKNPTSSYTDPTRSCSNIVCIGSSSRSTANVPQSTLSRNNSSSRSTANILQNTLSRNNSSCSSANAINATRKRDHAEVFDIPRSRSGSIHESVCYSSRDTPLSCFSARERFPVSATPSNNRSVNFSPSISTPGTPLTRGEIGYMGVHTKKAFNSNGGISRTASMSQIAVFSNGGPGGFSAQNSPLTGHLDTMRTPSSARSCGSMSSFFGSGSALPSGGSSNFYPQTPAEVEAAEQSMDEYLKAVRRRSFAMKNPLMNPEGPTSLATVDMFGVGTGVGASSSPTMPARGAYRRRSSLGLRSVLTSIVSTPADSSSSSSSISSCSTSSDLSSPRSITSPIRDDAEEAEDAAAFEEQKRRQQAVSAEDLLRAEYGDLYCGVGDKNSKHVMEPEQPSSNGFLSTPEASRSRSSSISSNRTSSSGSSESGSTTSNMTSLSNEEKRAAINNNTHPASAASGPPLTFLNKALVGSYRSADARQKRHQQHQKQDMLRRAGSSGNFTKDAAGMDRSGSTASISKKFPSQGDLVTLSRDSRKAKPI